MIERISSLHEFNNDLLNSFHVALKATYMKYLDESLSEDMINNDGYIEVYHNGYVLSLHGKFGALFVTEIGGSFIPVIVKETRMKRYSELLNDFITYHKLGHFYTHFDELTGEFKPEFEKTHKMIINHQCDLYAVQKMGLENVIEALSEMIIITGVDSDESFQMKCRIEMLLNKKSILS